jgi:hypothetical protein
MKVIGPPGAPAAAPAAAAKVFGGTAPPVAVFACIQSMIKNLFLLNFLLSSSSWPTI